MLFRLKNLILKRIYRLLIIKISFMEKERISRYDKLSSFATLTLNSDKGFFKFHFKEDRRARLRTRPALDFKISGYFVELTVPDTITDTDNPFTDIIAVVVSLRFFPTNYKVLATLLLDLYIESFEKKRK